MTRATRLITAATLCVLAAPARVAGQDRAVTQYSIESWDMRRGLPGNSIATIKQSPDGYLWIATQDGLARFDGVRFVEFTKRNTPALPSNDVADIVVDSSGVWLGINGGGVLHHDGERTTPLTANSGLTNNVVNQLHRDADGTLWVGTASGLNRIRGRQVEALKAPLASVFIRSLAPARGGGIWVGTERAGLFLVRRDSILTPRGTEMVRGESVRALLDEGQNGLWIGTTRGVFRLRNGALETIVRGHEVRALLRDADGTLWVGTADAGLLRLRNNQRESLTTDDGLPSSIVNSLLQDREGNIWVGTTGAGIVVLRRGAFVPVTRRDGLAADVALPITQSSDGAIWIGTFGGGLSRWKDGRLTTYAAGAGLSSPFVLSLAEAPDSALWIGTRAGLEVMRRGRISRHRAANGSVSEPVVALLAPGSGVLWIGTTSGLRKLHGNELVSYTTANGLPNDYIHAIHEDRTGALWLSTNGGGLARLRNGVFETFSAARGLGSDVVFSVHEDTDGTLWIATSAALTRLKNGRFTNITSHHGLYDDKVLRILADDAGNLWMSSNRGIFRVSRTELNAVADGRAGTVTSTVFTETDGLPSAEANGGIHPAGWKDRSGRLWFPTVKGAAYVDPAALAARPTSFPVRVERLRVNDRDLAVSGEPIALAAGARRVEFAYTALTFLAPDDVTFEHRLEGFDERWVAAGARRTAAYTNLPPGSYTFRVRAKNAAGGWNEARAGVPISIRPYFHQTGAFRVLAVLALLAAIAGLDRWRTMVHRRRERQLLALAEERRRAENRYRGLFEGAQDIVLTADLTGRITSLNRLGKLALGVSDPLPEDLTLAQIVSPDSLAAFDGVGAEGSMTGAGARVREITLLGAAGAIPAEASVQAIRENGRVTGLQAIVRDMTERKTLELKLRKAERLEAVGQLAGGIAHDFNNLLSVIKSTAELVRGDLGPAHPSHADIAAIDRATDRGADLTQQLLAFSSRQVLRPEVINLNDVVREIEGMLSRTIRENIELRTDLDAALYNVEADRGQIHQVLLNLAVNARDAMPDGGVLTIRTYNADVSERVTDILPVAIGKYACMDVRDTGTGMDARTKEQIFEPFFSTKNGATASGLGLATVFGIVQQSGGSVSVHSEPGQGSVFTVYLPCTEKEPATRPVAAPKAIGRSLGETILIVEDDEMVRTTLKRFLTREGYVVLAVSNGEEALQLLDREGGRVDLVLTDVVMPGMSGTEMAEKMLSKYPALKILYASGYTEGEITHYGVLHGGVSFMQKPVSADTIRRHIRELLDSRE